MVSSMAENIHQAGFLPKHQLQCLEAGPKEAFEAECCPGAAAITPRTYIHKKNF